MKLLAEEYKAVVCRSLGKQKLRSLTVSREEFRTEDVDMHGFCEWQSWHSSFCALLKAWMASRACVCVYIPYTDIHNMYVCVSYGMVTVWYGNRMAMVG